MDNKEIKNSRRDAIFGVMVLVFCIFMYSSAHLVKVGLSEISAGVELGLKAKANASLVANDKIMLNLQEAARFLSLSEDELAKMIEAEDKQLKEFGSFSGTMIPYVVVDGKKYFPKAALAKWAEEAGFEHRDYDAMRNLVN